LNDDFNNRVNKKQEQQRYRTRKRGKAIPAAVAENV
jgi:hypothetical protein